MSCTRCVGRFVGAASAAGVDIQDSTCRVTDALKALCSIGDFPLAAVGGCALLKWHDCISENGVLAADGASVGMLQWLQIRWTL